MIGTTVSHYTIVAKIGGGGMGVVYRAEDTKLKRMVALKFLPSEFTLDPEAKQRFINEAQTASALQHNNICTIHDIDTTPDGEMFIVMDLYEGETLKTRISNRRLSIPDCIDIAIQIAQGLQKAHEKGILHRDVKPANILVTTDGVAKIVDFGLAKLKGQSQLTKTGATPGTAAYMSPEQVMGEEVDQRADIWSLGVVLYEMVTGQPPFKSEFQEGVVYGIVHQDHPPMKTLNAGVPDGLELVVKNALEKDPGARYQNISEMLEDLLRVKGGEGISGTHRRLRSAFATTRSKMAAALVGGMILLAAAYFFLLPLFEGQTPPLSPLPIAVVAFTNQTGDKSNDNLRELIPDLLITKLEQSKYLRVTTLERLRDLLKQMGRTDIEVIDKDLGFELCRKDGVGLIVIGTYGKMGDMFFTDVKVYDVESKQLITSASDKGTGVESILASQIDNIGREITRRLLTDQRAQPAQIRVAEITTTSVDAYNYFLLGKTDYEKFYWNEARRVLEKAVSLDTTFAAAYLYLGRNYDALNDSKQRDAAYEKARRFSPKAPEKERLYIESAVAFGLEKDSEKGLRLLNQMIEKYPREKYAHWSLGNYYYGRKEFNEAISEFRKALDLDPDYGLALNGLAYAYAAAGDSSKSIECFKRYAAIIPTEVSQSGSGNETVKKDVTKADKEEPPAYYTPYERAPEPIRRVAPRYPEAANKAELEGTVWVRVWVDKQGKARKALVMKSDAEIFNQPAIDAAMQWIFSPAMMKNGPVSVWVEVPFNFRLHGSGR
jgi:eukaryotic-like serine/threonine-protein kinase